jgi:hypothetical protein
VNRLLAAKATVQVLEAPLAANALPTQPILVRAASALSHAVLRKLADEKGWSRGREHRTRAGA